MKPIYKWIIITLLTASLTGVLTKLSAQQSNSSFVGRRFLFNCSMSFSPAWNNPNFFEDSKYWGRYYSFNYILHPSLEVIAWRLGTVGVSYSWFSTKFSYRYGDSNAAQVYENVDPLAVHAVGLFYKQYFGGKARAPLGWYGKLELNGMFYTASMNIPTIRPHEEKGNLFGLKLELGYDYLFFNHLRVGTSVYAGFPFYKWRRKTINDVFFIRTKTIQEEINSRILGHYIFGATVTIGFLGF